MNDNKRIENRRKIGGDYFILKRLNNSNLYLKDYIYKFNFNYYWCFKSSGIQKLINYDEFIEFRYTCYVFFRKSLYNIGNILIWTKFFNGEVRYLIKPTPPFDPSKIIVIEYNDIV